jgi:hypothetical protein
VKFAYPGKKGELPVSPLMLVAKAGYPIELEKSIDKENRMTAQTALDLMAKILDLKIREIAK